MAGITFAAQIKRIRMMIDVCGDKGGEATLIFRDENQVLEKLNALMRPDAEVSVTIVENRE